ncbi:hypothetical protein JVT61DRAFT_6075 [Boletus reticuloceps]|uniref:Uncharacterized protein n=1 Tax=Boletus reticuloceps TaxID=495285 RepID=A0A8I2YLD0_9AGAM|nr:hypothetical protein JVT61DRAFT_6075 [Boletus reticuloceps]
MSIHSSKFRTALCFRLLASRASSQAVNECPPVLESVAVGKHAVQELCPRHYQKRIAHLVFAQLVVLCICNATLGLRHTWKGHERSLALVSASRITCLVGLLIQLMFHWASPRHVKGVHELGPRLPGTQVTMFLATLWFPYLPFVLSVFLLCNSEQIFSFSGCDILQRVIRQQVWFVLFFNAMLSRKVTQLVFTHIRLLFPPEML